MIAWDPGRTFLANICGASVVGPNAFLYAAHCDEGIYVDDGDFFLVNIYDRRKDVPFEPFEPGIGAGGENITQYIIKESGKLYSHPDYNDETFSNDLALFILNEGTVVPEYIPFVKMNFETYFPAFGAFYRALTAIALTLLTYFASAKTRKFKQWAGDLRILVLTQGPGSP